MNSFNVLLIGLDIVLIGLAGYYLFGKVRSNLLPDMQYLSLSGPCCLAFGL